MPNVLILGGGFSGVVAAESLAKRLAPEHQITLVSRTSEFIFYPALVRLAFGLCERADVSFDLHQAMLDRRIRFVQAEVARLDPHARYATITHGDFEGELHYDHLIYALGRRLATERVPGFFEYAHHLLDIDAALKFGEAVRAFSEGHAVLGSCPGARLGVPVYETAFALSRLLEERGERERARITIVCPGSASNDLGGTEIAKTLHEALDKHGISLMQKFPISRVTEHQVWTGNDLRLGYDLLMLIPPFQGASAALGTEITDENGYIRVDKMMRVEGFEGMYAAGDAVNFDGPKMGHMAVRQGLVAAENVAAEIDGDTPDAIYDHEIMMVIDEGDHDALYLHQKLWRDEPASIRQGRFWSWAKRIQEKYWQRRHA
jgi:NADH dehydrogenase FAD-containing subunit